MKKIKSGSKVLCVDTWSETGRDMPFKIHEITVPEKGKNYTVRDVVITTKHGTGIRLEEITNPTFFFDNIRKHEEPIFAVEKFQLIV